MAERGITIIRSRQLTQAERLAKQYGGDAADWVKKTCRLLNFGLPTDREDLIQKLAETTVGEWGLIKQNLEAVGIDNLKRYRAELLSLRLKLMFKVETLEAEITNLRGNNPMGFHNAQIIAITNLKWDVEDELIPINNEINEVSKAITNFFQQ